MTAHRQFNYTPQQNVEFDSLADEINSKPTSSGTKGDKGDTGARGATGATGPAGATGAAGPQGDPGTPAPTPGAVDLVGLNAPVDVTLIPETSTAAQYRIDFCMSGVPDTDVSVGMNPYLTWTDSGGTHNYDFPGEPWIFADGTPALPFSASYTMYVTGTAGISFEVPHVGSEPSGTYDVHVRATKLD